MCTQETVNNQALDILASLHSLALGNALQHSALGTEVHVLILTQQRGTVPLALSPTDSLVRSPESF